MGKLLNGYILPHPPVIVPGIGRGRQLQAEATVKAVKRAAKEIAQDRPMTIILSTPHAPCFRDFVYLYDSEILSGDFSAFGSPEIEMIFQNNKELYSMIAEKAAAAGISAGGLSESLKKQFGISGSLDHGTLVPLWFIAEELKDFKLVCLSTPFLSLPELYRFGGCISEAVAESEERVVYIASGDLSHRLTEDAPAGYSPKGKEYDQSLIDKISRSDVKGLLDTEEAFLEKAGECGTRSIVMMYGAFDGIRVEPEIYSYEGPFGVGYLIAKIGRQETNDDTAGASMEKKEVLDMNKTENSKDSGNRAETDYVRLARKTLETYIREHKKIDVPDWVPAEFRSVRAGVFVSLKKNGMLRGCIGTIGPVRVNVAEEIIYNAISAGTQDPRFPDVSEEELKDLVYSVDVLGAPEKIASMGRLDVKRYGVIVTSGFRRGLLLPDLEGVDTPEQQVEIALQKAGILSSEPFEMERFEVIRYR
jgi:AmmeMemoRadiSam system protein A